MPKKIINPKVPKKTDPKPKPLKIIEREPPISRKDGEVMDRELVKKPNTRENLDKAIELVMQGMTYKQVAAELGMTPWQFYYYRKNTPSWRTRIEDARVAALEDHCYEMAHGRAKGNPLCVMFLLKAAKPEIYRDDAQKITISATANAHADAEAKQNVERTDDETKQFLERMKKLGASPISTNGKK